MHKKVIDFRKIIYCKAEGCYTKIYIENGSFLESKILKQVTSGFPPDIFFRIHRSIMINTMYVTNLTDKCVTLNKNIKLVVSRRRKKELLTTLSKNNLVIK